MSGYTAICLLIKDENKYLKEWIDWHLSIGINHFYIYDNASTIPVIETINSLYDDTSLFTVVDWSGKYTHMQVEAYNHCLENYGSENEWIAFIDTDEFIHTPNNVDLNILLDSYKQYAYITIPWVLFNASGHLHYEDAPVQSRFTQTFDSENLFFKYKSIVQPNCIQSMSVHFAEKYTGETIEVTDIILNHYYTRSLEEWNEKILRGTCSPLSSRKYQEFFKFNPDLAEYKTAPEIAWQQYQKTNYTFDVRIMAHPSRRSHVLKMLEWLGMDEDIVMYDDRPIGGDAIYNAERTWKSKFTKPVTHRLVLQDDVLLCDDFLAHVSEIINCVPDKLVYLFNMLEDKHNKLGPYFFANSYSGCGIIMPVEHIEPCWKYINSCEDYINKDDVMISRYFHYKQIQSITTIPPLIQHLGDTKLNSLIDDYTVIKARMSPAYQQVPTMNFRHCIAIQDYYSDIIMPSREEIKALAQQSQKRAGGKIIGRDIYGNFIVEKTKE